MSDTSKKLNFERGVLKGQLSRFENLIKDFDVASLTLEKSNSFVNRLNSIIPILEKFNCIQNDIEFSVLDNPAQLIKEQDERESFENKYYELVSKAQILTGQNNQQEKLLSSDSRGPRLVGCAGVRLPKLELQTFNGTYTQWCSFKDHFQSTVHSLDSLTEVDKLKYLKSCLRGEPYNLISSLETTHDNYKIAWDILLNRYDNKRRIIYMHVKNILEIKFISKESHLNLKHLINTVQTELSCLKALKQPIDNWKALLVPIILNKLELSIVKDWEAGVAEKRTKDEIPSTEELLEFLTIRQNTLEIISQNGGLVEKNINHKRSNNSKSFTITQQSCSICQNTSHSIYNCDTFKNLEINDRNKKVRELKLCINCLRKNHVLPNCKVNSVCKFCQKRHHSLLHLNKETPTKINLIEPTSTNPNANTVNCTSSADSNFQTLLPTALVNICSSNAEPYCVRALLDSGSQSNFITEHLCDKLNLTKIPIETKVCGIDGNHTNILNKTIVQIISRANNYTFKLECLVIPRITSLIPNVSFNKNLISVPVNIKLADPNFCQSKPIDILLGSGIFWKLISIGQFEEDEVIFQKTKLGWIISGKLNCNFNLSPINNTFLSVNSNPESALETLNKRVEAFWKLDEFVNTANPILTPDEKYCEELFMKTTTRAEDGKFCVRIPFKQDLGQLGDSYKTAIKRFNYLEARLLKRPNLKLDYSNFINEYINMNHMSLSHSNIANSFYIPHHCVIKESSSTTKLRVVFDGSAKSDAGISINDLQNCGPNLQNEIFSIISRFRLYEYVLVADIEKMFRCIWMHPDDRKYQKIIWRDKPSESLSVYELNTVSYGMVSSPYLAMRSLRQIAIDHKLTHPEESEIITRDFYMDDLITGSNNLQQLLKMKQTLTSLLISYGFNLRKFNSNDQSLRDNCNSESIEFDCSDNKTLGIGWNSANDKICYSVDPGPFNKTVTKRSILSETSKLYDPLGLLAPTIIIPKLILQRLWQEKLDWDESLPVSVFTSWVEFRKDLENLNNLNIDRHIIFPNSKKVEMHTFCDASERAYGACIYIKSINHNDEILVALVAAKSRVAPIKPITIPRLELNAAVIAAQLANKFKPIFNKIHFDKEYIWSDSKIALSWIKSDPNRWKTYVSNRVSEIQQLTNVENWHYVDTKNNPADLISRGLLPTKLIENSLWWTGPEYLKDDINKYLNHYTINPNLEVVASEQKSIKVLNITVEAPNLFLIHDYSTLNKLLRISALCFRFINNCKIKNKAERRTGNLSVNEIMEAHNKLIKLEQSFYFAEEIHLLKNNKQLKSKSAILALTPFLDDLGLLRVGGRLSLTVLDYDKKHPILLAKHSYLAKLIMRNKHDELFHAGPKLLLCTVREQYWPIGGVNLAKRVVKYCRICQKFNSKPNCPIMGNLPIERTLSIHPFHSVGIDYAGPYLLKSSAGRGSKTTKAYICLFVCFATKCIHLELVSDLSTKLFLLAIKRFIARRGKPRNIFSDNATTFKGANKELNHLFNLIKRDSKTIEDSLHIQGITWKFIPPRSPSFGGLWESNIKRVKYHLNRVLSKLPLTYEEFNSLLVQVESILNSRPLSPLSLDPNDTQILTPAHFLIGRSSTSLPEPDVTNQPISRLKRYQLLQSLQQHFWKKWSKEFLQTLQQRTKWKAKSPNLEIGDFVLLKEENLLPGQWRMGRISQTHPGQDGVVRVVTVQTSNGQFKRAINKICPLPFEDDEYGRKKEEI